MENDEINENANSIETIFAINIITVYIYLTSQEKCFFFLQNKWSSKHGSIQLRSNLDDNYGLIWMYFVGF